MKERITVRDMCMIGVLVALCAAMAQLSLPMPMGVPMTMQTFAVGLCGMLLGSRKGALAMGVYLLIGLAGVPVFANFTGGIHKLVGPTGGFLISFPLMAWLIGLGAEHVHRRGAVALGMAAGTAANFLAGMLLYMLLTKTGLDAAFAATVLPFLPTAIIKALAAAWLGLRLRRFRVCAA